MELNIALYPLITSLYNIKQGLSSQKLLEFSFFAGNFSKTAHLITQRWPYALMFCLLRACCQFNIRESSRKCILKLLFRI